MTRADRLTYLDAAARAFHAFLDSAETRGAVDLRVPQLDPSSDVFCRRFVLSLTWSLARVSAADRLLRTAVLVQAPSASGATPLSVAGLARHLAADWERSRDDWPEGTLRLGLLDGDTVVDDDVVIIISPTNAVDVPTVVSVQRLAERAPSGTRVVLINGRLDDVPGHSGIMGVSGRAGRIETLRSFVDVFTCRLLYTSGTVYPVQGVLYHAFGGSWSVWRAERDERSYETIAEFEEKPGTSEITGAFTVDRVKREKARLKEEGADGIGSVPLPMLLSAGAIAVGGAALAARSAGIL